MKNKHTAMYLRMIWKAFLNRITRVFIASLSIAVGGTTLAALGLVAFTVPAQMSKELRAFGANMVILPDSSENLTDGTLQETDSIVGNSVLKRAGYQYGNLLYNQQPLQVMATDLDAVQGVRPYWNLDGKMPANDDEFLVGADVATRYRFSIGDEVGLMQPTSENAVSKQMKVSGIIHTGGPEDEQIVMSTKTLSEFLGDRGYDIIEYSIDADSKVIAQYAKQINTKVKNADAQVVRRISEAETGIATTLRTLIWIVSAIISLLTLIAVSTTLNSIISERSKEIGLKKALGALPGDVMREFVGESLMLGVFGGTLGAATGVWIAAEISRRLFAINLNINWWVVPITLIFSIVIAMLGCLMPARRITKIDPSQVLGGE